MTDILRPLQDVDFYGTPEGLQELERELLDSPYAYDRDLARVAGLPEIREFEVGLHPHRPLRDIFPQDVEQQLDTATFLQLLEPAARAELEKLISTGGNFIWASDSPNFEYTAVGRDTFTIVKNLAANVEYHDRLVALLIAMVERQGITYSPINDEQPGATPHEIRAWIMDGGEVGEYAKDMFERLRKVWSDDPAVETIVYYGELDGPARLVSACYALAENGVDLESKRFIHMSGEGRNLLDACREAIGFIEDRIEASSLGLVELQPPKNPETLMNQTLKDSTPAYLYKNIDGKPFLPNRDGPRAPLEAQIVSFEALLSYAKLVRQSDPQEADRLEDVAATLRQRTLRRFVIPAEVPGFDWPKDAPYVTAMLDRDPLTGKLRQLNTLMLDPAEGLGRMFADQPELVEAITRVAFSKDFLTDVGLRCRGLRDSELFNFAGYHGALSDWIVCIHTVAKRLYEQGSHRLAKELWVRMSVGMVVAGSFQEFIYVDTDEAGSMLLPEEPGTPRATVGLRGEEDSQTNQAWSISATIEAIELMKKMDDDMPMSELERDILGTVEEPNILPLEEQYRDKPGELLTKVRKNTKYYLLDQIKQTAGAHEAVLSDSDIGGPSTYLLTPKRAAELRAKG